VQQPFVNLRTSRHRAVDRRCSRPVSAREAINARLSKKWKQSCCSHRRLSLNSGDRDLFYSFDSFIKLVVIVGLLGDPVDRNTYSIYPIITCIDHDVLKSNVLR
jgi:hypothetical protein